MEKHDVMFLLPKGLDESLLIIKVAELVACCRSKFRKFNFKRDSFEGANTQMGVGPSCLFEFTNLLTIGLC